MGFHLPSGCPDASAEYRTPSVTPAEYLSMVEVAAVRRFRMRLDGPPVYRTATGYLCGQLVEPALRTLLPHVGRHPGDAVAHGMLGMTYLAAGRVQRSVGHLEVALNLFAQEGARASSLCTVLQIRQEMAYIRLLLLVAYGKLGLRHAMRRVLPTALTW